MSSVVIQDLKVPHMFAIAHCRYGHMPFVPEADQIPLGTPFPVGAYPGASQAGRMRGPSARPRSGPTSKEVNIKMRSGDVIRPIEEHDWEGWKLLWAGYLHFYRETLPDSTTRLTFERLCNRDDGMFGYVATSGADIAGLVHAVVHPSTWSASCYCYLEDLFVAPGVRGTGIARELIEVVAEEAATRGAERVYWHTQEFNGPARSLYDQVARRTSFVVYQR